MVKYTSKEDVAICMAYVKVTEAGTQDPKGGWNRVYEKFDQIIEENKNRRTASSISTRFDHIAQGVQKYICCLKRSMRLAISGSTVEDIERKAIEEYQEVHKKQWSFAECYEILRALPKYNVEYNGAEDTVSSSSASR